MYDLIFFNLLWEENDEKPKAQRAGRGVKPGLQQLYPTWMKLKICQSFVSVTTDQGSRDSIKFTTRDDV